MDYAFGDKYFLLLLFFYIWACQIYSTLRDVVVVTHTIVA